MRKRSFRYFIGLILICGYVIYVIYINTTSKLLKSYSKIEPLKDQHPTPVNDKCVKILFWTPFFGEYDLSAYAINQETFKNCQTKCEFLFDNRLLSRSDAVIFHVRDDLLRTGLPPYHAPYQRWVFFLLESPDNTRLNLEPYSNVFNWTMTYRRDSDIYHPYSRIQKVSQIPSASPMKYTRLKKFYREKTKLVAWVVSNCHTHSNRESFVLELEEYISVDKYGACGNMKLPPSKESTTLYGSLAKTYKFYLAFENSLCVDYVSEKFFDCLKHGMIPVVYGGANYSLIAPPGSFIDSRKFRSSKDLAIYLKFLDSHPEEYIKYFRWKEFYRVLRSDGWCSLCTKLTENAEKKSYYNISKWWTTVPEDNILYSTAQHNTMLQNQVKTNNTYACLPYPTFANEIWFVRLWKKYFILDSV